MRLIYIIFLLFCSFSGMAQVQIGRDAINSTIIGKYTKNVTDNNTTIIQTDSVAIKNISRKEAEVLINALNEEMNNTNLAISQLRQDVTANSSQIFTLEQRMLAYEDARRLTIERERELQAKKYNYLPFGVHQFKNKQTGKGILFSVTEIGLLGTSLGYHFSSGRNFNKHRDDKYDQWERDRFYSKYKSQQRTSRWLLGGALVVIGLNYCDNFDWFRHKINDNASVKINPVPMFEIQGKPQMALAVNINF